MKAASSAFTEADKQLLAVHLEGSSPYYCRMCQSCSSSCREGLPVSDLIRYLMYAEGYGNLRKARQCFRQLPAHLRAKRCENCAGCTVRCVHGVRVREQVSRAQAVLS